MLIMYIVACFLIVRVILILMQNISLPAFNFRLIRKNVYTSGIFVNNFIESRTFFATRFNMLPNVAVITEIDATKAYALITEKLGGDIVDLFQANMFDYDESRMYFTMTIIVLANNRMIEIGNGYVEVLYASGDYRFAEHLIQELANCRIVETVEVARTPTIIGFARNAEMN